MIRTKQKRYFLRSVRKEIAGIDNWQHLLLINLIETLFVITTFVKPFLSYVPDCLNFELRQESAMGWRCKTPDCTEITFRRPPKNFCQSCRSCRRGCNRKRKPKNLGSPSKSLSKQKDNGMTGSGKGDAPVPGQSQASQTLVPSPVLVQKDNSEQYAANQIHIASAGDQKTSCISKLAPLAYDQWRSALETRYEVLVSLMGFGKAHAILGMAHEFVSKFEKVRRPLVEADGMTAIDALISITATLAGEETDAMKWVRHCSLGKQLGKLQTQWIATLPSAHEIALFDHKVDSIATIVKPSLTALAGLQ